jgi:hypothetical protein
MTPSEFTDYYELMQISPNAELETIQRVYRMRRTSPGTAFCTTC